MAYDTDNTGILNKADKGDNPKRPDYKGSVTIAGVEYWLSGWIRTAKTGKSVGQKFISLSFAPKDKPKAPAQATNDQHWDMKQPDPAPITDDDVPF